jgi:hypothetical protein
MHWPTVLLALEWILSVVGSVGFLLALVAQWRLGRAKTHKLLGVSLATVGMGVYLSPWGPWVPRLANAWFFFGALYLAAGPNGLSARQRVIGAFVCLACASLTNCFGPMRY